MWGVPRMSKLNSLQSLSNKIGQWRLPILIILILGSVIVSGYSIQSNYANYQAQNRPIVVFNLQNSKLTMSNNNTTATIDFAVQNIGINPAYNVYSTICWASESQLQNIYYQEAATVNPIQSPNQITLPVEIVRHSSDRWYIYYLIKYSDAIDKGTEYAEDYWYSLDFNTQRLSDLLPTQKLAFQPYIDEFFAKQVIQHG